MIRINLFRPERKDVPLPSLAEAPLKEAPVGTRRRSSAPSLILLLTIVAIAALILTLQRSMAREQRLLQAAEENKRKLVNVLTKLEELEYQKSVLEKKINLINLLKSQREIAVRVMNELSQDLPEWVWLNEVTYDNMTLRIRGRAMSNTQIAEYIANLERSDILSQVSLIESTLRTQRNEQFLEFTLSAYYGSGPPPPTPPGGAKRAQTGAARRAT